MDEGQILSAHGYQTLVVHKVCRFKWLGQHIPDFLAFFQNVSL